MPCAEARTEGVEDPSGGETGHDVLPGRGRSGQRRQMGRFAVFLVRMFWCAVATWRRASSSHSCVKSQHSHRWVPDCSSVSAATETVRFFQTVLEEMPELYPFIRMCYTSTSLLSFGDHLLMSDEGFQQGDPLGPLLFCASSLKLSRSMMSELNLWYLDDGTLGGRVSNLLQDLGTVLTVGPAIGLHLNKDKCEIITGDDSVVQSIRAILPNIRHIPCAEAVLLGAPIGDETSVDTVLSSKLIVFRRLASHLTTLHAHDALCLLKNCFSTPKLPYTLRCAGVRVTRALSYQNMTLQLLGVKASVQTGHLSVSSCLLCILGEW